MAIAYDSGGSAAVTTASTSFTVDITSAATGAECFCWNSVNVGSATMSITGWTSIAVVSTASTTSVGLFYRRKVAGDTTFTGAQTSGKGVHAWVSYTGCDSTTPYEAASSSNVLAKSTAATTVASPSVTESGGNSWAVGFFCSRTSTTANKAITWTPPGTMTERFDANNSAASSGPWNGVEIADTAANVTAGAHSYTATASFSESFGAGALIYLNPPTGGTTWAAAGTVAGVSAASGAVTLLAASSGAVAGSSTASGAVTARLAATGTVAAVSATSGTAGVPPIPTSGTVAAVSGATGAATARLSATGTAAAQSTASGAATALLPTTGSAAGVSTASGSATVVGGPQAYPATGTLAATSTTTGAAGLRATATGQTPASSTTTGAVTARYASAGTLAAESTTSATAALLAAVSGSIAAASSSTGAADVIVGTGVEVLTPDRLHARLSILTATGRLSTLAAPGHLSIPAAVGTLTEEMP